MPDAHVLFSAAVPSIRKRAKAVANRKGQMGCIERRQSGERVMARVKYWADVSGQHDRKRVNSEWQDVTGWGEDRINLWRMQIIGQAGVMDPKKPIPNEVNFETHAKAFLDENLHRYKISWRATFASVVRQYLIPAFGKMGLEDITGPVANKWIGKVKLLDGTVASKKTLKHLVGTLQVVLGRNFDKREIRYPADAKPKERIYCPTDEEIGKIVAEAEGVHRLLFAMAPSTGMRAGELYGLHIEDIDFERGAISIRQSLCRGVLGTPKTDRATRTITVSPDLIEMIRQFIGERTKGFVLQTPEGTPLHHSNVLRRHLHPLQTKLGLRTFGLHSFRHYSVSFCVRAGMSFDDVRMRHGHGSEDIMKMYLHLAPGHDARTLKLIPNIAASMEPKTGPKFGPKENQSNVVMLRKAV